MHEHGPHICYCPSCNNYSTEVGENVKCNTLYCPQCGARLRARETGEYRVSAQYSPVAENVTQINDQPIAASFFGEGRWLTDFITPDEPDVRELYSSVTRGLADPVDRIIALRNWVANRVRYVQFVRGHLWINGKSAIQNDLWTSPSLTIQTKVGNCAVKSFLLTSLLRNELPADRVYCTMGNLYNGKPGGHAWVTVKNGDEQIMETTVPSAPAMVPAAVATRYESVHYFNDKEVYAVPGRTQLVPMAAVYSTWLERYLKWAYIEAHRT
jgi:hypothetical protein